MPPVQHGDFPYLLLINVSFFWMTQVKYQVAFPKGHCRCLRSELPALMKLMLAMFPYLSRTVLLTLWPCVLATDKNRHFFCIVNVTYYSSPSGLYQSLALPVWASINPQSHKQPHIHRGQGVIMPFMGLKQVPGKPMDSFKTGYLSDHSAQRKPVIIFTSVIVMCVYIWAESVSLHKLVYWMCQAHDMRASEDSGSSFGVSTWCLVSRVMTNRWVLLLALTSYWWEFTTIHGHKHFGKLACERTVCQPKSHPSPLLSSSHQRRMITVCTSDTTSVTALASYSSPFWDQKIFNQYEILFPSGPLI